MFVVGRGRLAVLGGKNVDKGGHCPRWGAHASRTRHVMTLMTSYYVRTKH
jgi:hypothetical protein